MPTQTSQICLSDGNREALIIRWRTIIILGLQDYFTNENIYPKIIVKEILDMFEGLIKAFGESLRTPNIENMGFMKIFDAVRNHPQVPPEKIQRLEDINNSLSANELNSIRNLFRNPESHSLNLPSIPAESVMRCWRLFNEAVKACDESIFTYAQNRPEFKDFSNLHTFFYRFVIGGEYIDLRSIKLFEKPVTGKDQKGKVRDVKVEYEQTVSELIQYISNKDWLQ